jgi:hypothetical protein
VPRRLLLFVEAAAQGGKLVEVDVVPPEGFD